MEIEFEDDALYELYVNGKKQNPKYSKLPDTVVKGYVKAVNKLQLYKTINDVWRDKGLHYEKIKNADFCSVRCNDKYRLHIKECMNEDGNSILGLKLIKISNHYGN